MFLGNEKVTLPYLDAWKSTGRTKITAQVATDARMSHLVKYHISNNKKTLNCEVSFSI
jgi:peptidyl-tRNA hydrolase